jgi:hypothetical protein
LQRLDAWVGPGPGDQVALQPGDQRTDRIDQGQAVGHDGPLHRRQGKLSQQDPTGRAPQRLLDDDAPVGQDRVHPALEGGGDPDQRGSVAQQGALVADSLGSDPGLGQQLSAQPVGQGSGIDLVVFAPGRGDRLAAAGVDQMRLQLQLLQQLGKPAPAIGGLERDRRARLQAPQERGQLGGVVGQVAVEELAAVLVHQCHLGALAVDVHADVHPHQASFPELVWLPEPMAVGLSRGWGPTSIASVLPCVPIRIEPSRLTLVWGVELCREELGVTRSSGGWVKPQSAT